MGALRKPVEQQTAQIFVLPYEQARPEATSHKLNFDVVTSSYGSDAADQFMFLFKALGITAVVAAVAIGSFAALNSASRPVLAGNSQSSVAAAFGARTAPAWYETGRSPF